jgi:cell wall-associated NlpC family hydrolase
MGDRYVNGKSGAPGSGIDASGLVIQSCYGAGVDIWPVSPATRPSNCVPKIWGLSKLGYLNYTDNVKDLTDHPGIFRGDLIFFNTGGGVGHVAIYLGWDKIIHADMVTGRVGTSTISKLIDPKGKYRYSVYGAKRIFK